MKLSKPLSDIYVPDGSAIGAALERATHLGVGAHQDDLEVMAAHGILECFGRADLWFGGITCTDGAGSPRAGVYAGCTDEEMKGVRLREQRTAAMLGGYGFMLQLGYSSAEVKGAGRAALCRELVSVLEASRPRVVYTHNPADKHDTHVAVTLAVIDALRAMPAADRPERVYGCEVWRDLDWLGGGRKVTLPLNGHENLEAALLGAFDSQIAGGKRYDLATLGRRRANATYNESHEVDAAERLAFAVDLTPLAADSSIDVADFTAGLIDEFRSDVAARLARLRTR